MGNKVSSFIANAINHVKDKVLEVSRRILPPIVHYVAAHPVQTAFTVISAVPSLLFMPVLGMAGFTGAGIARGSLAAGIYSSIASVAAGSVFATL
ncbi:hypothetical protein CC78DRAFT_457438 [Lojkania enalia]|uniref:Uncharacterized protein n=1 Tax=Lojkania enalia TaxID=147567 RepID=A0A9P4KGP0_9PLEO|nr:hypothetical protein CC78DRAFT_457438 [Didymosphaeria enalia]